MFTVGNDAYFNSVSPLNSYGVAFEDDLETGYFYAIDTGKEAQILDALHIYNVKNIVDRDKPSKLQIVWSKNGMIAFLLINNYCHAIFDFEEKAGYCRNGFPENLGDWSKQPNRILNDALFKTYLEK